jgi:hypothetical protein
MMVSMAMTTEQLPWALVVGAASAIGAGALALLAPWRQMPGVAPPDQAAELGHLLLSRYMIGFEGAAFLILGGIAGAVILGKREQKPTTSTQSPALGYACPMHPDVRSASSGVCPRCGMQLVHVREPP